MIYEQNLYAFVNIENNMRRSMHSRSDKDRNFNPVGFIRKQSVYFLQPRYESSILCRVVTKFKKRLSRGTHSLSRSLTRRIRGRLALHS